jgi:hypothetical protein
LCSALDKLSLSDGRWPTDRNRMLKVEHGLRAALRAFQPAEGEPEAELSAEDRANAAHASGVLKKLSQVEQAKALRPQILAAADLAKALAPDAVDVATATDAGNKPVAAPRAAARNASTIKSSDQSSRRPMRRGIV